MTFSDLLDVRRDGYSLEKDIAAVSQQWPLIQTGPSDKGGLILHVAVRGIRGGKNKERRTEVVDYIVGVHLLTDFPQRCQLVWIIDPPKDAICHLNVFANTVICLSEGNTYQDAWNSGEIPLGQMSIVGVLLQVNFILKNENRDHPAR